MEEGANHYLFPLEDVGDPSVPTEVPGHYHPLALRAVASYFKDQYSKLDSIVQCGKDLKAKKNCFSILMTQKKHLRRPINWFQRNLSRGQAIIF